MKVFITKYALTSGIKETEVTPIRDFPNIVKFNSHNYIHKPFWHENEKDAINHAENIRTKRIESLKKQITKLEKLKF